jgi:hypothetical protein
MAINVTEEGDDLTAASVDNRLQEVADEYNALSQEDLNYRRLNHTQTPALINVGSLFTEYSGGSPFSGAAVSRYDNTLPTGAGADGGGVHTHLELFAPSGPYGPYTRGAGNVAEEGWLIPSQGGNNMEVVLNGPTNMTDAGLAGIKATAWVNYQAPVKSVETLILPVATEPSNDPNFNRDTGPVFGTKTQVAYAYQTACYLGIGIVDSAGTRHVLNRTIRRISPETGYTGAWTTTTLIRPEDLSEGTLNGTVREIFGAVLSALWLSTTDQHASRQMRIKNFQITIEPVRGGDLVL